mmetsp:Transcript_15831/g.31775  ORF Transcript_15831/g.31775 Transcript_15831/m.31775 type:complete len:1262 (-) Transcript_15831:1556-5341(-)
MDNDDDDDDVVELGGEEMSRVELGKAGTFDRELYGSGEDQRFTGYDREIDVVDEGGREDGSGKVRGLLASYTVPEEIRDEADHGGGRDPKELERDVFEPYRRRTTIAERESEYHARGRRGRVLSPERKDAFNVDENGTMQEQRNEEIRSYAEVMRDEMLSREEKALRASAEEPSVSKERPATMKPPLPPRPQEERRKRRWDVTEPAPPPTQEMAGPSGSSVTRQEDNAEAPAPPRRRRRWDVEASSANESMEVGSALTPMQVAVHPPMPSWDDATPSLSGSKRSRWDETPAPSASLGFAATPMIGAGIIPETPMIHGVGMTPEMYQHLRWQQEIVEKNRPWTDEELDSMLPSEGFVILEPPVGHIPPPRHQIVTHQAPPMTPLYSIPVEGMVSKEALGMPELTGDLEGISMKPEDYQNFAKVLRDEDEASLSSEEIKERRVSRLLLKIKNGTPSMRKSALRQISDKAREFGPGPLFNQILPLLMSPTLEDNERHLLVKVIDRILYRLDDLVRPYVHKILVVIEPLLIDEDYYARVEGREIISNLAKAAGLASMIATMRPDIDNADEYVRNTTARAFAVVASALGIPSMLPFLKAVCRSKKSWEARHTGIKIVQQIAILMGCAVLPHLRNLVEIIEMGLVDEQGKVRTVCALALAALAESAAPYGIESFDSVLKPLWKGIRQHHGKTLAAFLKAIGFIIPLMDAEYASYYTREVMTILIREFRTPDDEMKKIILKVVKQCVGCEGVEAEYIKTEVLPEFFRCFWIRRMALDKRNYRQVVETTEELATKVGGAEILRRLADDLKDDAETYRRMVVEVMDQVIGNLGVADIDNRLRDRIMDGMLHAFQEQGADDNPVVLSGLGTFVEKLGLNAKQYLEGIAGIVKWRLNNKSAKVRQQAAELTARIASVMKLCNEERLMGHLGLVLYEYLGEEYPDVLGSILAGLKAIVSVIGIMKMTPPVQDLLPRLTPILRNRHEKVQENCIDLLGRIADRGAEFISSREWMRICFELLELLKAPKKAIRRATVSTFGYIARAIGPQDVLATLLNNLKVQERQQRVCTTVAIAIVAETCQPFTVLPALMNEYRIPELNVQNGVLKSLSFLFEYIGEMAKDYIYAVVPLLEDALIDRDLVHRQTACTTVGHIALGVRGLGCEDALVHLLNHVWPNVFETSPHVINAVLFAISGCMVSLGPTTILLYVLEGLFHPARKVREIYWKIYNNLYIYAQEGMVPAYPALKINESDQTEDHKSPGHFSSLDRRELSLLL